MRSLPCTARFSNSSSGVLLHGKNFCAGTWEATIKALSEAGYRVVAPDQIGFCKSSKPERYQYSFQQLAANTRALLLHLGIERSAVIGHSTGGMLAARYALLYPQHVDQLVLVNPIGLEDWKALGVPWRSIDEWYERELKTTAEGGIRENLGSADYAVSAQDDWSPISKNAKAQLASVNGVQTVQGIREDSADVVGPLARGDEGVEGEGHWWSPWLASCHAGTTVTGQMAYGKVRSLRPTIVTIGRRTD